MDAPVGSHQALSVRRVKRPGQAVAVLMAAATMFPVTAAPFASTTGNLNGTVVFAGADRKRPDGIGVIARTV